MGPNYKSEIEDLNRRLMETETIRLKVVKESKRIRFKD